MSVDLLQHALSYRRRWWSVIPIRLEGDTKKPPHRFGWTRFSKRLPTEREIERWFGPDGLKHLTGVAVILGEVSGGLVCRDFDNQAAYHRWAAEHPNLAATLPTVRTSRGFHVYARCPGAVFRELPDGEFRAGANYCLLPPSVHPSGILYEWLIPLPAGDLPSIDPVAAGFLPSDTEQTEKTEQTQARKWRGKGSSSLSALSAHSPASLGNAAPDPALFDRLREPIELAIARTLPTQPGQRNRRVFSFVRALQGIPEIRGIAPKYLHPLVRAWHRRARPKIKTKEFDETWTDFLIGWRRVKYPMGDGPMERAFARARSADVPEIAERYDDPKTRLLVALCRELQRIHGDEPFFLSCRQAGRYVGLDFNTANRRMTMLVQDGVLVEVRKGTATGRATRFKYVGGD